MESRSQDHPSFIEDRESGVTPHFSLDVPRYDTETEIFHASHPGCKFCRRAAYYSRDTLALQTLAPLSSSYVPWTASAMRPSGLATVLNDIMVNQRRCTVELGGGTSTYLIGRLLLQQGGHLFTVEHNERWADLLDQQLRHERLRDVVTVVRAPLKPNPFAWPGEDSPWYDQDKITDALGGRTVDLLLIDGPPAWGSGREHSRFPAVPVFAPILSDEYGIILDDIGRTGEQDIMKAWEREFGITFERRWANGDIGISHRGRAFTI